MVNVNMLRGKIVEHGYTITQVANEIGIEKSTLYRKLQNDGAALTIKDANLIVALLHLSGEEAMRIFFSKNVA